MPSITWVAWQQALAILDYLNHPRADEIRAKLHGDEANAAVAAAAT